MAETHDDLVHKQTWSVALKVCEALESLTFEEASLVEHGGAHGGAMTRAEGSEPAQRFRAFFLARLSQ